LTERNVTQIDGIGPVKPAKELAGRAALVTGSARNIGRAIAIDLARGGAAVMINARTSADEAGEVAAAIRSAGGRAEVRLADVAEPEAAAALVEATVSAFGRLDILVNNASVRREVDFVDLDYRQWREILAITLDGAYLCSHAALPHLKASGAQGLASIVNIGGLTAHSGAARRAHVVAAKAGLTGLTRALAHDLAADGVTVNCVAPGLIDTSRGGSSTSSRLPQHHAGLSPLTGRRGRPEEVAALVRFLCGPEARYITGQTMHVNGGLLLG
jgi:3-oxoacyl-[acyl-carrier protein] reductase